MGHYIQNTGNAALRFLEMFRSDRYADISLNQWLALVPSNLVRQHLNVGNEFLQVLHKDKRPVV